MNYRKEIGNHGEEIAADYLAQKGYEIHARNIHAQGGEIDILAFDPLEGLWVLVEVKTRTSDSFGTGAESITPAKIEKMLSAAEDYFLKQKKMDEMPEFRMEAIIITRQNGRTEIESFEVGE